MAPPAHALEIFAEFLFVRLWLALASDAWGCGELALRARSALSVSTFMLSISSHLFWILCCEMHSIPSSRHRGFCLGGCKRFFSPLTWRFLISLFAFGFFDSQSEWVTRVPSYCGAFYRRHVSALAERRVRHCWVSGATLPLSLFSEFFRGLFGVAFYIIDSEGPSSPQTIWLAGGFPNQRLRDCRPSCVHFISPLCFPLA